MPSAATISCYLQNTVGLRYYCDYYPPLLSTLVSQGFVTQFLSLVQISTVSKKPSLPLVWLKSWKIYRTRFGLNIISWRRGRRGRRVWFNIRDWAPCPVCPQLGRERICPIRSHCWGILSFPPNPGATDRDTEACHLCGLQNAFCFHSLLYISSEGA